MRDEVQRMAPILFGNKHPYGADQPAAAGAMLNQLINSPGDETLFIGLVTDCSTHSYSCTVTIPNKTAGFGFPCVWLAAGLNRHGGCSDSCPPEIGSTVFVYKQAGSNFGVVLGQVPALLSKIEQPGGGMIDPAQIINAFNPNTGQVMKEFQIGGSALNGYQTQPNDAFPGDRALLNELGVGVSILRTMAQFKGSDLAKIEAFLLDDLLRLTAKNLDVYTGAAEVISRDEGGLLTTEINQAMTHWESLGALEEDGDMGTFPIWRLRTMIGYQADLKRQFVSMPVKGKDDTIAALGVAEHLDSSDGLQVSRSIVGGGIVKSRQVAIPTRVRTPESIAGAKDEVRPQLDPEDLSDFWWKYTDHGDITVQMRDALAWIMGRQANARLKPYDEDGKNPDWVLQDEADAGVGRGNPGANTGEGGHFREMLEQVVLEEMDLTGLSKPRAVRIGDAWIFVLPDGSVTIRDSTGAAITMTRGHITHSASKDVNIIAGRNVNIKAGDDINLNARQSIDVTAGNGQARIYARKSAFLHSEDGGILLSTNSAGRKSEVNKQGEEFDISGIILKPHKESDVVVETRSMFVQAKTMFSVGGVSTGVDSAGRFSLTKPSIFFQGDQMMHKINQANWQLSGGKYIQFINGATTIDTDGNINTEANVYALFGTMKMNSTHDSHEDNDFCNTPGDGYQILKDRLEPIYENIAATGERSKAKRNPPRERCGQDRDDSDASNRNTFDWFTLHSVYDRAEIGLLEFSLRTERDYGTNVDDFSWTEQPWMREWKGAQIWGTDASTSGSGKDTWCYPGTKYWTGTIGFTSYTEANVEPNGDPKKRADLNKEGGEFKTSSFQNIPRHPTPERYTP